MKLDYCCFPYVNAWAPVVCQVKVLVVWVFGWWMSLLILWSVCCVTQHISGVSDRFAISPLWKYSSANVPKPGSDFFSWLLLSLCGRGTYSKALGCCMFWGDLEEVPGFTPVSHHYGLPLSYKEVGSEVWLRIALRMWAVSLRLTKVVLQENMQIF